MVDGRATLSTTAGALLAARAVLACELRGLEKRVRKTARTDARTRLLMSAPGVDVIVALTYVSAVDESGAVQIVEAGGRALRSDAKEVSVG